MKVLFLDFDGVLNTASYRKNLDLYLRSPIEREKLSFIKKIVDATDAEIVLSTSWRRYWQFNGAHTDKTGILIDKLFSEYGVTVTSKTPSKNPLRRDEEIDLWLRDRYFTKIESYCILDDVAEIFPAETARNHLVLTDGEIGITDSDVKKAISMLLY